MYPGLKKTQLLANKMKWKPSSQRKITVDSSQWRLEWHMEPQSVTKIMILDAGELSSDELLSARG